ncbi:MAG: antibiotic biosynthesis monooxygenase [Planctomycetota bacterium]
MSELDAISNVVTPPYYAVIFTSKRSDAGSEAYGPTAARMVELARGRDGFLGVESTRGADGLGITVSYWRDVESIRGWREQSEHQQAQAKGRDEWYTKYVVRICRVEHAYAFGLQAESDAG